MHFANEVSSTFDILEHIVDPLDHQKKLSSLDLNYLLNLRKVVTNEMKWE